MKKLLSLLAAVTIVTSIFAQSHLSMVKETVGNADILKNWDLGETKYLNNASILRVAGENAIDHRTNLFFTSNKSIMNRIEEKAQEEMLSEEMKKALKDCYLKDAPGGQLSLFFDRNSVTLANPALFTILVKDAAGNIMLTKALDSERPYYYQDGIWYYYTTISLPVNVGEQFSVEVADAGLMLDFTFSVVNWEDAGENQQFVPVTSAIF